jgi:hypothetical protein
MSVFGNTIDPTEPQGSEDANTLDTVVQNLKAALIERIGIEHYAISDGASGTSTTIEEETAQGRHIAGKVGFMGKGTYATMQALTSVGIGACWESTTASSDGNNYPSGTIYRYTSSGWVPSQWGLTGTIYADATEAVDETTADKALSPAIIPTVLQSTINPFINYALFQDVKDSGVNGQAATTHTFVKRNLVEVSNSITGCSISSDVITLPAGTYRIQGNGAAGGRVSNGNVQTVLSRCAIFEGDVSTVADILISGNSGESQADYGIFNCLSHLVGIITLASETDITFRQWTNGTYYLGTPTSTTDVDEIYATLEIWRLA